VVRLDNLPYMALNAHSVAFLAAAQRLGTSFEATLQLGRQVLGDEVSFSRALARAGVAGATVGAEPGVKRDGYADSLFGFLGASSVDSLDVSDWEGATIIHDLNQPFPQGMRQRFSAVLDAGTLEHVFEFPTALRSSLDAVRSDGHFLCITPTNNWCGHGFYQFSPETYFSFLPAAGFKIEIALVRAVVRGARPSGGSRSRCTAGDAVPAALLPVCTSNAHRRRRQRAASAV